MFWEHCAEGYSVLAQYYDVLADSGRSAIFGARLKIAVIINRVMPIDVWRDPLEAFRRVGVGTSTDLPGRSISPMLVEFFDEEYFDSGAEGDISCTGIWLLGMPSLARFYLE